MKRTRLGLKRHWRRIAVGGALVAALGLAGYSYADAMGKPTDGDLEREYERGVEVGEASGESTAAAAEERLGRVRENGYWEGWEEGTEEGEGEGQRTGAELATPAGLDFQTRYMVTYEPGNHGPMLRGWLEMPLNTLWECEDLDSCSEIGP
jgi:hypothetical protein